MWGGTLGQRVSMLLAIRMAAGWLLRWRRAWEASLGGASLGSGLVFGGSSRGSFGWVALVEETRMTGLAAT